METLRDLLLQEFVYPFAEAIKLFQFGILRRQSYLALLHFDTENSVPLVSFLLEELTEPIKLAMFKNYSRTNLNLTFDLVSHMGE